MLQFKNNLLTIENSSIEEPDYILQLTTDIEDCNYLGVLTLSNRVSKTIQFIKIDKVFKARLSLKEEDLNYLNNATLKLICISSDLTKESNLVSLNFNIDKIKLVIKQKTSNELTEIYKQLNSLQTKLEALTLSKLVPNVSITNKDYIKPGMTLIAIDNGNFMAAYPFADVIKQVNGQQAVDGVVVIDASMIKYTTERTIKEQLDVIAKGIISQNEMLKTLTSEYKVLSEKVANLSIKLETHLDSGIV